MNLEIFDEKKTPDDVLRVKLFTQGDRVILFAVNEKGQRLERGALFYLRADGTGCLPTDIGPDVPVQKTHNGALKIVGD